MLSFLMKAIAVSCTFLFANASKDLERAITIWEAKQGRSHSLMFKTDTKNKAKRLRATTFAIRMLEEQ